MKKIKMFAVSIFAMFMAVVTANAQDNIQTWNDLATCLESDTETVCKVGSNIELTDNAKTGAVDIVIHVHGTKTLDLAGYTVKQSGVICANETTSDLTIIGGGILTSDLKAQNLQVKTGKINVDDAQIIQTNAGYSNVYAVGVNNTFRLGANASLKGGIGILIQDENSNKTVAGSKFDIYGSISAFVGDSDASGMAITINGAIKDTDNLAVINIYEGAKLSSDETAAIYAAGPAIWNISGGEITGDEAISIKSGTFNISGGKLTATGEYSNPEKDVSGATVSTGATISVMYNKSYAGNVKINITDGELISEHGNVLYAGPDDKASEDSAITDIDISGGKFIAEEDKETIYIVNDEGEVFVNFITGGQFLSNDKEDDVMEYVDDTIYSESESGVVGIVSDIIVTNSENGEVTADKKDAAEGEEITLTVTANDGYELDTLVVTDEEGKTIEVKDNKFTMPKSDVTVTATFKKIVVEEQQPTETEPNPNTYDASMSYMSLALLSLGSVIVSIKKLRNN